jgi:NTP pyrophosphatase (non-canonical NTP hydrolase)
MEDVILKSVNILLQEPEEDLLDKDEYIVKSIVKGIDSFTKICKVSALHRKKPITQAKREDIAAELSKILFYASLLSYLCDVPQESFEIDSLTTLSETFPDEHQQDSILCSLGAIRNFTDIAEVQYGQPLEEDLPGMDDTPPDSTVTSSNSDDDSEVSEIEVLLAEVFASVIILCERFELDLEAVMDNVTIIPKP